MKELMQWLQEEKAEEHKMLHYWLLACEDNHINGGCPHEIRHQCEQQQTRTFGKIVVRCKQGSQ